MKPAAALLLLMASSLLASPCDSNPRVSPSGLTMACSLDAPKELILDSPDANSQQTLTVSIATLTIETRAFSIVIGYIVNGNRNRKPVVIMAVGARPAKNTTTISLPIGATLEFVQVDELILVTSAGFTQ